MTGGSSATLRCRMLFLWFDHPPIEGWTEARLWAELHREDPAPSNDRPLQGLEVPVIEALPDVTREAIERGSIHSLDQPAPALDNRRHL